MCCELTSWLAGKRGKLLDWRGIAFSARGDCRLSLSFTWLQCNCCCCAPFYSRLIAGASRLTQNICKTSLTTNRLWRRRRLRCGSDVDCIITEPTEPTEPILHDHLPLLLWSSSNLYISTIYMFFFWGLYEWVVRCSENRSEIACNKINFQQQQKLLTVNHAQTWTLVGSFFALSWHSFCYYYIFWSPCPGYCCSCRSYWLLSRLSAFVRCLRTRDPEPRTPSLTLWLPLARSLIWVYGFPLVFCVTLMPSSANAKAQPTDRTGTPAPSLGGHHTTRAHSMSF